MRFAVRIQKRRQFVSRQAASGDGAHILDQQPRRAQLADQKRHSARRLKMIDIRAPVGIQAAKQRRDARQRGEIVPLQNDAASARHRRQMNRVIGRAAARQHADDCVDKSPRRQRRRRRRRGLLGIRAVSNPNIAAQTAHRGASQRRAQRRSGIDKRCARQLQAHQFEHHLIRVRGAVKSASPGRVIRRGLRRQQRLASDFTSRMALPHARFFGVVKAGRHRPRGRENDRQMAESRRRDRHSGRDFVAHAQKNNR